MEPTDFAHHVDVAVKKAIKTYKLSWDRWSDDLAGEAWLAVCEALDGIDRRDKPPDDLNAYVYCCIRHRLAKYIDREWKEVGHVRAIGADPVQMLHPNSTTDDVAVRDELDRIYSVATDETDERILELRGERYTYAEIGEKLRISTSCVHERFKAMEARLFPNQ